jgi:uncharacterized protein (DUF952 family)
MDWGTFLARGIAPQPKHKIIYHMCVSRDFENANNDGELYFPPTYHQDGFIHATAEPELLLSVGNHFYKSDTNHWICLGIDVSQLVSRVKYEPGSTLLLLSFLISSHL